MERKNIKISGSEKIDIDPVQIDTSLVGQATAEYDELKAIIVITETENGITNKRMSQANEKLENLIKIAKKAIIGYKAKKNEKRKEELTEILIMVKKAKTIVKGIERRYMLESDNPEVEERRRLMTGWTRDRADRDPNAKRIKDIDIPIIDASDLFSDER